MCNESWLFINVITRIFLVDLIFEMYYIVLSSGITLLIIEIYIHYCNSGNCHDWSYGSSVFALTIMR